MTCPKCSHQRTIKFGIYGKHQTQRFRCRDCGTTFNAPTHKPLGSHTISIDRVVRVFQLLTEGMSVRATAARRLDSPVDLHETPAAYVITAELPGLKREDLEIHVVDGSLTLSGVRPEREVACEQYHRVERGHGSFSRTFHLPVPVEADGILADLRDGILTMTCPKANNVSARRIRISQP